MRHSIHAAAPRRSHAHVRRAPLPWLLALALGCGAVHAQSSQPDDQSGTGQTNGSTAPNTPRTLQAVQVQGTATPNFGGGEIARQGNLGALGEQDLMNTPFSMTSYTEDYIANHQAYTIADVVANDPAVRVGDGFGNFAEVFVLRGFPLDGDDITFDGLYGIIPRQLVDADAIGRLDVLRGASAFLYGVSPGGSGIGGSINVEPKWALDTPLTRATVDYGSDSQAGAQLDFSRRFGPDDRYGIRVDLGGRDGDTAIDRESRHSNHQSIAFDYRGEKFRIKADISHQLQRIDDGRNVVYLSGDGVPKPPPASANYAQPWSYSSLEDTYGVVRAEYDFLPDLTGYITAGADHSNETGEYWSPTVDGSGNGSAYRLGVPYQNDAQTGEAGLNAHLVTGAVTHKINLSVSALNQKKTVSYTFSSTFPADLYNYVPIPYPPTILDGGVPVVTGRTKLHSLALSDTLGFADDQVLLTVGARQQSLQTLGYAYGTGAETSDYRKSATSPVIGLVVKLNPNFSLFANSIQGLSQGPEAPIGAINVGQVFPPYRSRQLETGIKYDQGGFGSTFSLFQIKQPNGITSGTPAVFSIAGEQRNRGAEWSIYGEPVHGLKLIGGASYIDAKLTQTQDGADNGNTAVGVPKWQYNAGLEWAVPHVDGLGLDLGLTRTAAQYADVANTLRIPAWTRVDAGIDYATTIDTRAVTFRAAVLNLANSNYWASALGGYLTEGAARTVKLSASVDF
ncbi:TonB-dependent siderophore receptor [Dyella jejuensis]|uniref:TonB-dependent siderophore receptor n=1 Tax=Dyella jejuensis TaxID=1432009 RepID=A0ABW8JJG6_9GAMM